MATLGFAVLAVAGLVAGLDRESQAAAADELTQVVVTLGAPALARAQDGGPRIATEQAAFRRALARRCRRRGCAGATASF